MNLDGTQMFSPLTGDYFRESFNPQDITLLPFSFKKTFFVQKFFSLTTSLSFSSAVGRHIPTTKTLKVFFSDSKSHWLFFSLHPTESL